MPFTRCAGLGRVGQATFDDLKPYLIPVPFDRNFQTYNVLLKFIDRTGQTVKVLRADILDNLVQEIQVEYDRKGCANAKIVFNRLPDLTLNAYSKVEISTVGANNLIFSGLVKIPEEPSVLKEKYTMQIFGLRWELTKLNYDKTYAAGSSIRTALLDIVDNRIVTDTLITKNDDIISSFTDTFTGAYDTKDASCEKILDFISEMVGHYWGVDNNGDFYFRAIPDDVEKSFFAGYNAKEYTVKMNVDSLANEVNVLGPKGTDDTDLTVIATGLDALSCKKYGKKTLNYEIPGFLPNESDGTALVNALLEKYKEPLTYVKIKDFIQVDEDDFIMSGYYRFIDQFQTQSILITGFESNEDVDSGGDGAFNTTVAYSGVRSYALTNASEDDTAEFSHTFSDQHKRIKGSIFRCFFNITGNGPDTVRFTINFNDSTNIQRTFTKSSASVWTNIEIEVDKSIESVDVLFTSKSSASTTAYFDSFELVAETNKHYDAWFYRSKYKINNNRSIGTIELGEIPPQFENYVRDIKARQDLLRIKD